MFEFSADEFSARKRGLLPTDTKVRSADGKAVVHKADGSVVVGGSDNDECADAGEFFVVDTKPDYRLSLVFGDWLYLSSQDVPQGFCLAASDADRTAEGQSACGGPPRHREISRVLNVAVGMPVYSLPSGVERVDVGLLDVPEESILSARPSDNEVNEPENDDSIGCVLPASSALGRIVALIRRWREEDRRVLIHCNAGVSRSATAVIGYLIVCEGMAFDEAYGLCRESREGVKPNAGFEAQLRELEKRKKETIILGCG